MIQLTKLGQHFLCAFRGENLCLKLLAMRPTERMIVESLDLGKSKIRSHSVRRQRDQGNWTEKMLTGPSLSKAGPKPVIGCDFM